MQKNISDLIFSDDVSMFNEWLNESVIAGDKDLIGLPFRIIGKNKGIRWFIMNASVILDEENKVSEVIGVVIRNLGARRMDVLCSDKVKRVARIPGRFRRGYRITVNDVVLVEPWEDLSGERGDITYRYRKNEIRPLSRRYKKELDDLEVEIPRVFTEDEY